MNDRTTETEPWEARFRVPLIGFPHWSRHAPDRLVYASTEGGRSQLYAWDRSTGRRRRVTDDPVGVTGGWVSADGEGVVWHRDDTGAESGTYRIVGFHGGTGDEPLADGLESGWDGGSALGRERSVVGLSDADGFAIYVVERDGGVRLLRNHEQSLMVGGSNGIEVGSTEQAGLSADERLVCIEHAEHGDLIHQSLRVVDALTGETVGELHDRGQDLAAFAWSPVPGDDRLLIAHERAGERRAAIWHVREGRVEDLASDLEGLTEPADWWPDASAVLLVRLIEGRSELHRVECGDGRVEQLPAERGSIFGARVRPDGAVWYRSSSGEHPPRILEVGRSEPILEPSGAPVPASRPLRDWEFRNPLGQRVHGFLIEPAGTPPFPLIMAIHGGPTWLDLDRWLPDHQAYADAGFLVAEVNYRGSIGFGREWRDSLIGNIGWPEVEDILAGFDDLVTRGLADPTRAVMSGWSWGGYLTLLMHGMHPERFIAGVAGVPVGDYADGYEQLSPILQAYDRALLGGAPSEVPDLMAERSPISYVDRVRAPILFIVGRNDSRCPLRQALIYTDRLKARGQPHELYLYDTGHSSYDIEEQVRQRALVLDFLSRTVPGIPALPGVRETVAALDLERVGQIVAAAG